MVETTILPPASIIQKILHQKISISDEEYNSLLDLKFYNDASCTILCVLPVRNELGEELACVFYRKTDDMHMVLLKHDRAFGQWVVEHVLNKLERPTVDNDHFMIQAFNGYVLRTRNLKRKSVLSTFFDYSSLSFH